MKNVMQKKKSNPGLVEMRVKPPPIPFIRSDNYTKSDKDCVTIKLPRYPMA